MAKKKALGQGLDALFGDNAGEDTGGAQTLRMSDIEPNRNQRYSGTCGQYTPTRSYTTNSCTSP